MSRKKRPVQTLSKRMYLIKLDNILSTSGLHPTVVAKLDKGAKIWVKQRAV